MLLDNYDFAGDEKKRPLYVAMTRAKRNLVIHHNISLFGNIRAEGLLLVTDRESYLPPSTISMQLSYTDVNLGYSEYRQNQIKRMVSGDNLIIGKDGCTNSNGEFVLKFSRKYQETIAHLEDQGYHPKDARINFIVFWKDSEKEKEFRIILPELDFER